MSTTHLDRVLIFRTDHMQTTLLPALLTLVYSLQNDVGQFRLLDGDHLHREAALLASDHTWEWFLADFALKLSEVVGHDHACHLLLYLAVDPHLQA
jgi:hypothetical protein